MIRYYADNCGIYSSLGEHIKLTHQQQATMLNWLSTLQWCVNQWQDSEGLRSELEELLGKLQAQKEQK